MFIIVEGCDGVGKTTLVDKIIERLAELDPMVQYFHHGVPEQHPLDEYETEYEWYEPGTGKNIVVDRHMWGELVYAPLYREGSLLGGYEGGGRAHVEAFLRARGAFFVHVYEDAKTVRARLEKRGEDYLELDHIEHVLRAFEIAARTAHVPNLSIKSTKIDKDVVDTIIGFGARYERFASSISTTRYIGPTRPKVLLFGEARSNDHTMIPFMPYNGTSGKYLLDTLGYDRTSYTGMANALEVDVHKLWTSLGNPNVVSLGKRAQAEVKKYGVPGGGVPHPQFVRRFHYDRHRRYVGLIDTAATHGKVQKWPG